MFAIFLLPCVYLEQNSPSSLLLSVWELAKNPIKEVLYSQSSRTDRVTLGLALYKLRSIIIRMVCLK